MDTTRDHLAVFFLLLKYLIKLESVQVSAKIWKIIITKNIEDLVSKTLL